MLSQWVLALYINIWWCSAICNKNLELKIWKQFKKTDLTFLPLLQSDSDMLWLKFNICMYLKLKYIGIHVFLLPRCFTAAFFFLNIKNITFFISDVSIYYTSPFHLRALVQIQLFSEEIENIWKYLVVSSQCLITVCSDMTKHNKQTGLPQMKNVYTKILRSVRMNKGISNCIKAHIVKS